jgi:hypothetical protein
VLSLYLKIPLLTNYHLAASLIHRDASMLKFKELELSAIQSLNIDPSSRINLLELMNRMNRFSQEIKCRKLIMKINGTNNGVGLAIVNMPINNIDDMYNKSMAINAVYYNDIKLFFKDLLR